MALSTWAAAKGCLVRPLLRLLKLAALGSAALLGVAALLFIGITAKRAYDYHLGFNQSRWLMAGESLYGNREGSPDNPRASMVADVQAHYLRLGMTRAQVLALLGPADSFGSRTVLPDSLTGPTGWANTSGRYQWSRLHSTSAPFLEYGVGWGLIDPISLAIQLDSTGRVSSFWVHEH